jgi:hypothetical protein
MTNNQASQIIVDLANLRPDKEGAVRHFRDKYGLEHEVSALQRQKYGDGADVCALFFRDLAQRLWTDLPDQGGIDLVNGLLFPDETTVDVRVDWRHQRLAYRPKTKLQAAFYALLGHNHLAKRCANPVCSHPFFIGDRIDERYCSDDCKVAGRLATKRNWWKANRSAPTMTEIGRRAGRKKEKR